MKKQLLALGIALGSILGTAHAQRNCGTMDYRAFEEQADPKITQRRLAIEDFTQNFEQQQQVARTSVVYNIPVVFHVVYNNATENISDTRLMEQLDVLNKDFRKLNTDINLVPAAWQSLAADCEINFCLATIDPSGNPTTGITRTSTTQTSFTTDNKVKYNSQGGKDIWNRDLYLNIWVCDLGGGLLGYAQFPGGAAATDGVVLDYAYTGVTGASSPYNLGRTATHEVGHWLNLYHIWGDDNGACTGSDQVTDTPNQANSTGGCPTGTVTDGCTGSAPGIMWMNYMDYTNDACMYFFTLGQRTRVQAAMTGPRAALASSNRCTGAGVVAASFTSNVTSGCAPFTVQFTDQSIGSPTSWSWNFGGGGTPNTSTAQNPSITFSTPGTYTVTLTVSNGSTNDTETMTNYIVVQGNTTGQALPFTEDFESGLFTTNGWTIVNSDASTTWEIVTTAGTTPGTKSAKMDFYNYATTGQRDGMVTPALNLSGLASAQLYFEHAYRRYNTSSTDSLIIYVSTTCGVWTRLLALGESGSGTFGTANTSTTDWTPTGSNQWCMANGNAPCYTINLTPYVGQSSVRIKFEGYNNYGNNLFIDNINITGVPAAAAPVANFSASTTTICAGQSITFTDQSTNSPTSWAWNFGGGGTPNTSTAQNPTVAFNTAGTYTVTLTATNGNGSDQEIRTNYIVVRANPTGAATPTATTCGLSNGSVALAASGGQPGYSYAWSNGATTGNISGLAAGTYTVTITDANTCTGTVSTTVTATAQPTGSIQNVVHTTCGQANGSASVSASSGTSPYTYLWSNSATTASATGLAAGSYTVTVTDASGCTFTRSTTINSSAGISATISATTPASCGSSNGTATASATGGASYTYLWSNGQTTQTASGLAAGSYTVTVTSNTGCTTTAVASVSNSGAPTSSIQSVVHTSCGLSNGSATATASGGSGTLTYTWSNGATTAVISGLAAGNYSVTVTDQASCSSVSSVTINASSAPSVQVSAQNATCGQSNGSATAIGTGGSGNLTYSWSNGGSSSTITGLAAGTYLVTVTDAAGCTVVGSTTITSSAVPGLNLVSSVDPGCGLSNGTATVSGFGGTGALTYAWSNGQSGSTASNMAAGSYTVTVTDQAGCNATLVVTLQNGPAPTSAISQTVDVLCNGDQTGSATVQGNGGTAPYTFLWSDGQTTATANSLAAGSYSVTVTDAGGCTSVSQVTITEPAALSGTTTTTDETGVGANDGTATVTPSGGVLPYTYQWMNGQTTQTSTGLATGVYNVTITDANGCQTVVEAQVGLSTKIEDADLIGLEVYPNPNNGAFLVTFDLPAVSATTLTVYNALGQLVWQSAPVDVMQGRVEVILPSVSAGVYNLELRAEGIRAVKRLIVQQ